MTCPECDRGMDENFKGDPGGPTAFICRNCGLKMSASTAEEMAAEEKEPEAK